MYYKNKGAMIYSNSKVVEYCDFQPQASYEVFCNHYNVHLDTIEPDKGVDCWDLFWAQLKKAGFFKETGILNVIAG